MNSIRTSTLYHFLRRFVMTLAVIASMTAAVAPVSLARGAQAAGQDTVSSILDAPLFSPAVAYKSAGRIALSVAVADLNGDGKPDLVVPSMQGDLGILLGKGDGTFNQVVALNAYGTSGVAVADLNGDGYPDIVATNMGNVVGTVEVLLGKGDGSFQPTTVYSSGGAYPISVAINDINGDGKPDLVVANEAGVSFGGLLGVLLGNGDGTFQPPVIYDSGGGDAWSVSIADVNADRKPDLIVANVCSKTSCAGHGLVTVLLNNGDGEFLAPVAYDSGGFQAFSVAVADVNGDGKPDIAVANVLSENIGVLLGNGDGTFQPAVTYAPGGILGNGPQSVALADVNGDGKTDLLVANCASSARYCAFAQGSVGVLLGNGDGTFQPAITYSSAGPAAWAVAAADLNGDGKRDLVVANYCSDKNCITGSVGVLMRAYSTSTTLVSSLNPSTYGQKVTLTARVTTSAPAPPTGTVVFMQKYFTETSTVGTAALTSGGVATLTTSNLNAYSYQMLAAYRGDINNLSSTSEVLVQTVLQTTSAAALTSSLNPSRVGQAITFTAIITSPTVIPTGPVTFTLGQTTLGTIQLRGGKATFTTSSLPPGSSVVKVTYDGDSNIARSSAALTQVVQP